MVNIKFGFLYFLPQKTFLVFFKHLPSNHLIYAGRKEVENGYQHRHQQEDHGAIPHFPYLAGY